MVFMVIISGNEFLVNEVCLGDIKVIFIIEMLGYF